MAETKRQHARCLRRQLTDLQIRIAQLATERELGTLFFQLPYTRENIERKAHLRNLNRKAATLKARIQRLEGD